MGSGKGTSTSKQAPPKEIMEAYRKSIGYAGQAISKPYEQYQGQLTAGLSPTQQQGIANVNAAQGAALPYIQQGAGYVNQAAQGVNPQMINQFMSPYLNTVVGATQRNLLESNAQQQNALKSQAIQSGAFGGDRARIGQAELARQQGLAGGQVIGGLMNQGFNTALSGAQQNVQNMMQGGQMLGGMGQAAQQSILQGAQAQLAAGAQEQATEQAFLQSAYDQFLQRQAFPFQQAQFYANIAQGIGAGSGGTTSQTPAAPNPISQALGLVTAIGTISDERTKENIEPIGETNDGQTIYRYNYKGSPKTEIGLIAQEVEKTHPEAVGSLGGIKMVDLGAATENSAQRHGKSLGGSSMGGLVTPDMQRQAFAQGGFGMVPYADFRTGMSFVPEGALAYRGQSPGSTLPAGYKMEELQKMAEGSSFDELNAMSEEDIVNLKKGFGKIGTGLGLSPASDGAGGARASVYSGPMSSFGPSVSNFFAGLGFGMASGGGVVPRHGYQTDGAVEFKPPTPEEVEQFIIETAKAKGIDPDEALRVYASEGLTGDPAENWQSKIVKDGVREESYGPFQLNMGPTGLGTAMLKQTGVDPRDPKNWQSGVDFGLTEAKRGGWKPWMGAANIGLTGAVTPYEGDTGGVVPETPVSFDEVAGVVPPDMVDVQANYSPKGVVVPAADEAPVDTEEPARRRSIIESILGQDMSDQARTGVLAAGLAMMGGTSPYFGVNVGKGGLAGLQAYYKGLENQRENAVKRAEIERTLAEALSTAATGVGAEQGILNNVKNEYLIEALKYSNAGKPYPSWEEYLKSRGFDGKGWEIFDPTIILQNTPASETTFSDATETGVSETATPAAPGAETEEGTNEATATPAADRLPSAIIQPGNQSLNIPNTLPDNNPYFLSLDPSKAERFNKLMEQGWTTDINGNKVTLPFSKAEIDNAIKLNNETTNGFAEVQKRLPVNKNIANQIVDVLQKNPSGSLTTLKGQLAGIWAATPFGSEEDVSTATAADLLTKLYGQLAVGSEVQGAATNAGSEKIKQVATSLGGPNIQPSASREIMGTTLGAIAWQEDMIKDWGRFLDKHRVTGISERMRNEFIEGWNNKLDKYVDQYIGQTPVKGELKWLDEAKTKLTLSGGGRPKKGYQYIAPNGKKLKWNGEKFLAVGEEQ